MMRLLKILVLALFYVFLGGRSCQDDQDIVERQLKETEALKESIRSEFGAEYLSEDSRYALEMTAVQKVKDLADYVSLYSDKSLDPSFREKTADMIRDMFVSGDVRLSFGPYRNGKMKYLTVEEVLDKGLGKDVQLATLSFDLVRIEMPLKKSGPEIYEGTITAIQRMTLFTTRDTMSLNKTSTLIPVHVSREKKIFGHDTLYTWAVRLGEMMVND